MSTQASTNAIMRKDQWAPGGREDTIAQLKANKFEWDLIVVGGGITGAGIYREAAGRGLKVLLIEQQDFAWGTSSRSSKMVHGGLRYLGSGQMKLAWDSVRERQKLLNELPGLVDPLPFLMAHYRSTFPGPWLFDKVLAVYDWMAGKRFRQFIRNGEQDRWAPGIDESELKGITRFADAVTDDARLVLRVLHDGNEAGGTAVNYLRAVEPRRRNEQVCGLEVEDVESGERFSLAARSVINATGAWTDTLRAKLGKGRAIRPLRGSHLCVPYWRLPVAFSVSFFHPEDKRPVFVFPWEGISVIGTTDLDHRTEMNNEASITEQEVDYLLHAANTQFNHSELSRDDVISTWSGVRPVVRKDQNAEVDINQENNPSDEKREHAIWNDGGMISIAGGKLTTYRLIATEVLEHVQPLLRDKLSKESLAQPLPFVETERRAKARRRIPQWRRLLGRYGRHAPSVYTCAIESEANLGKTITWTDTLWSELEWACQNESIQHLDDLLLRRTRLGLLLPDGAKEIFPNLQDMCQRHLSWDEARWQDELTRYLSIIERHYSLPTTSTEAGAAS